jgi:tryptophan synthase alpha chain
MTYWNPIEKYGVEKFAQSIKEHGGSGVITPDLTIEESDSWKSATKQHEIHPIYVVAPSTSTERLPLVTSQCGGFVYAASLMGVTGARTALSSSAPDLVARIRKTTELPVAVGLGVSTRAQAKDVAGYADGVIVGSAFIKALQDAPDEETGIETVKELAQQLAQGVREATMKKYQPWIGLIARLILGGTLIAAGYLKFDELDKSQMAVRAYELLPVSLANFLGTHSALF